MGVAFAHSFKRNQTLKDCLPAWKVPHCSEGLGLLKFTKHSEKSKVGVQFSDFSLAISGNLRGGGRTIFNLLLLNF